MPPALSAMAIAPAPEAAPAAAAGQLQPPAQQVRWAPASAATLRQLVALLAAHEPDLRDLLLGLCKRRHFAAHRRDLPPHPEGPQGTFAVIVPMVTTAIAKDAFYNCTFLSEIALPPNLTKIGQSAFQRCTFLSEITLPPNLNEIGRSTLYSTGARP